MGTRRFIVWIWAVSAAFFLLGQGNAYAMLIFNDGGVHEITTNIFENIGVYDGPAGEPTTVILKSGETSGISVFQNSIFQMTGGVIEDGHLGLFDNSVAEISGGSVDDNGFRSRNSSRLTITGGTFYQMMQVFDQGTAMLVGREFTIDDKPVPYGRVGVPMGELSGTLENGSIHLSFFTQSEGAIYLVPEPGTLVLLGLGGWSLLRRSRRTA